MKVARHILPSNLLDKKHWGFDVFSYSTMQPPGSIKDMVNVDLKGNSHWDLDLNFLSSSTMQRVETEVNRCLKT